MAARKPRRERVKPDGVEARSPAPDVTQRDITDDLLPDGIPQLPDGTAAEDVPMTEEEMRRLGATDIESAQHNQAEAEYIARQRRGEKNLRFGDTDPLARYETTVKTFGADRLTIYIQRVDPPPAVNLLPLPGANCRDGRALYDALMRNYHRQSPSATYVMRVREGGTDRCQLRITLPDTTTQTQQPSAPWMQPGMGFGGPVPMGYPPPPPPGYNYPPQGGYPGGGYPPQTYPEMQQTHQAPPPPPQPVAQAPAPPPQPVPQEHPQQSYAQPSFPQPQYAPQPPPPQPIFVQPPPAPAPVADPNTQAWMGAMHQQMQQQAQMITELMARLDRTNQSEQAKIAAFVEDVRAGRVPLSSPASAPVPGPQPIAPLPELRPDLRGDPGWGAPYPRRGEYPPPPPPQVNPYEALASLPRPGWWPNDAPWPPDPRDPAYWRLSSQLQGAPPHPAPGFAAPPQPAAQPVPAPAAAVPAAPPAPAADPYAEIKRSFDLVGNLVSLADRMRGVAPAINHPEPAPLAPVAAEPTPSKVEIMKVGDMDVAIRPDTGDIHWIHTIVGAAPKVFGFLEKFTKEAASVAKTHAVAEAVQSGKMPIQYIPQQYQQPQVQPAQQGFVQAIPVEPERRPLPPQQQTPLADPTPPVQPPIEQRSSPSPMGSIFR